MTNYVWYPVSGDGTSVATGYVWNGAAANWNTGSWIVADLLIFGAPTITPGDVPGSGIGTSTGTLDNVGLVAGNINSIFLHPPFYSPNGAGNPFINSNDYPVDLLITPARSVSTDCFSGASTASRPSRDFRRSMSKPGPI